ncbi:MAG: tRNA (adenosine(37)-N6)-dimethylallyltransferase MiaA [Chloroflexi bacterium]|nr:tRNA (adenosine(37)-N6)-dimethylallyltransferase MiaA [Chloroflexota bacterium]
MVNRPPHPRVIAFVGPTASGKTDLSLSVAEALGAEIVSADSRQVYRGMDIGTGKPSQEERARAPHHLFDIIDPDEDFSLAAYLDMAREAITAIHDRGHPILLVGGTGQYVWALLEGWQVPSVPPNPELRLTLQTQAEKYGPAALYAKLTALDPESAAIIDPQNIRRVIRALEVMSATSRRFSEVRRSELPPWAVTIIGLTMARPLLDQRIADRIDRQIAAGWVEEIRQLQAHGYETTLPSFSSIGYREIAAFDAGQTDLKSTRERVLQATKRLARRQYAWFGSSDPRVHWLDQPSYTETDSLRRIVSLANSQSETRDP